MYPWSKSYIYFISRERCSNLTLYGRQKALGMIDDVTNTREDANVSVRCSENDNVSSLELFKRNWVFKW